MVHTLLELYDTMEHSLIAEHLTLDSCLLLGDVQYGNYTIVLTILRTF